MGRKCKDYTNQIYGCWKVIERDYNPASKSHETFWLCECQNCGNKASVRKSGLDRKPQTCNKCKGELISQTKRETDSSVWQIGDKYGLLTITGKGQRKGHKTYVKVQCDCGSNPFEVRLDHLKGQNHSRTISCGCLSESSGELKIRQILEKTNISFQSQYRIKDDRGNWMIFDFVLFDKNNNIIKCIEYNGKQHYRPVEIWGGEEQFQIQKERDQRKTDYCNVHEIKLQWIPYTDFDNINLEMLLS